MDKHVPWQAWPVTIEIGAWAELTKPPSPMSVNPLFTLVDQRQKNHMLSQQVGQLRAGQQQLQ